MVSEPQRSSGGGTTILELPVAAVPLWVLAIASATTAALFLVYRKGLWGETAWVLFHAAAGGALFWTLFALLVGARSPVAAAAWERLYLPVMAMMELGLLEAALRVTNQQRPPWFRWLWLVALLGLAFFSWPHTAAWFAVYRVPDGFWMLASSRPLWIVLRALLYGAGWMVIEGTLLRAALRQRRRRYWAYAAAPWVLLPLLFNDLYWVRSHLTPYPLSWLNGFLVLGVLWWELHTEVRRTYQRITTDKVSRAASRDFADLYARSCLATRPVGVLYGDIDGFKDINDAFGHAAGDRVLRELVDRARKVLRDGDQIARMGGDEFLVILPDARATDGPAVKERLLAALAHDPIRLAAGAALRLNFSLGWSWGPAGSDFERLTHAADIAMYREKSGRRRPRAADAPTLRERGVLPEGRAGWSRGADDNPPPALPPRNELV